MNMIEDLDKNNGYTPLFLILFPLDQLLFTYRCGNIFYSFSLWPNWISSQHLMLDLMFISWSIQYQIGERVGFFLCGPVPNGQSIWFFCERWQKEIRQWIYSCIRCVRPNWTKKEPKKRRNKFCSLI